MVFSGGVKELLPRQQHPDNGGDGQFVRIRWQIRQKNSWLTTTTVASVVVDCLVPGLNNCDQTSPIATKTCLLDVYEPSSTVSLFSADSLPQIRSHTAESSNKHNQPANCFAFLFLNPSVVLLNVSIDQSGSDSTASPLSIKALTLGWSRKMGDIGFEYCGRDRKWQITWTRPVFGSFWRVSENLLQKAGRVNVIQFGLRSFGPTVNISFYERVESNFIDKKTVEAEEKPSVQTLNNLSPELICRIVSHIPTEFHIKAISALSGTSRRLRAILCHPSFYSCLDLKLIGLNNDIQADFLTDRAAISSRLRHLRLAHTPSTGGFRIFTKILLKIPDNSLTTLVVSGSSVVDDAFLATVLTRQQKSLQHLDLSYCLAVSLTGFSPLRSLINLEFLSVGATAIDKEQVLAVIKAASRLKAISLFSLASFSVAEIDQVCHFLGSSPCFSTLKAVDLSCSDRLTLQGLQSLAKNCHQLEEVNLRRCGNRNVFLACDMTGCGGVLAENCPKLRVLGLPIFISVQDIRALTTAPLRNTLEEVYIHEITDSNANEVREALRSFISSCSRLRYLTIRRHSSVEGVVDEEFCDRFLESHGVTVTPLQW